VALLRDRLAGQRVEVLRFGVHGNLAWNVLQRLDAVLARKPDVVTVLICTNDVNATQSQTWQSRYRKEQHLPQAASLPWYRESVAAILERVRAESDARIIVLDIPILGEDLGSRLNPPATSVHRRHGPDRDGPPEPPDPAAQLGRRVSPLRVGRPDRPHPPQRPGRRCRRRTDRRRSGEFFRKLMYRSSHN
jgi:hypothetical protein